MQRSIVTLMIIIMAATCIYWVRTFDYFGDSERRYGCKELNEPIVLQEGEPMPIEQMHQWGWGKIPKQNLCPHCGKLSFTRYCTDCKKERGNLPFIGIYCPKCNPDGKYAGKSDDVTEICGDCGSNKTWKYIYEDWQTEPNEPEGVKNESE